MGIFSNFDNDANCVVAIPRMNKHAKRETCEKQ